MRIGMSPVRVFLFAILIVGGLLAARPTSAVPVAQEGFAYPLGDLIGQNGGSGDWKDAWSADTELDIVLGSYSYTDSLGNTLATSGGHVALDSDPGGFKKAERSLNSKVGTIPETYWLGAILDGSASSSVNNISLGDGLIFGQGLKDSGTTTWGLADQTGLIADTSIAADARAFLVVRIDFTAGDENVWLWVDPLLSSAPLTSAAHASGTVNSFEADFLRAQLETFGAAGFDEIRLGLSFVDATPYTPPAIPQPGTGVLLGLGLIGLTVAPGRRPRS